MMLSNLEFQYKYRSDHDSLFNDFYLPCLENSSRYDRAAGYFTSNSLKLLARGLETFLYKEGKIRVVANPKLSVDDVKAIEMGYLAREEAIEKSLIKEIELSSKNIQDDTLNVISWLIYKGQLEIRIAYLENSGIYHEKFGIFYDEFGDSVAFSGSLNETYAGLNSNFEKIDVYTSEKDEHRVLDSKEDFEDLWIDNTPNLKVIDLPESIKLKLIESRSEKIPQKAQKQKITLRDYQNEAIESWQKSGLCGIFEMATGTGKTFTSLMAAKTVLKNKKRLCTVIIVPFQHLVDQWADDVEMILGKNIIKCFGYKQSWSDKARESIQDYNLELLDEFIVITTYATAQSTEFKSMFKNIVGDTLLIADECHYLTIRGFKDFPFYSFTCKLGLSATPDRWWDDEGTRFIKSMLGNIVYSYELIEAIENNMLTEYKYYPNVIELDELEMYEYNYFTKKIVTLLNIEDEKSRDVLASLFRKRASIISKAKNKIPYFLEQISKEKIEDLSHTLVYCAPGQTNIITKELNELGLKVSKFNSELSREDRKTILKMFEDGQIQVLVAMKCLDEGVDIPCTKKAFFLSSTSNPKEFVQRRGRILRNFEGKVFAEVYDYITLPMDGGYENFKNVATKELPRFAEFSEAAINSSESRNIINKYLVDYNLSHLMYRKPWEIYKETQERLS